MSDNRGPERQREVQRLLGRCLLRLQQYEHLMKHIVAQHELAGPVDTLAGQLAARADELADKTLGTLVKALFETFVVGDGYERELLPEDKTPADRISMAISYRLMMEPRRLAETQATLKDLIAMRNDLVHHLIDRFDLWSDDGCEAAVRHLEGCYERVDRHHLELTDWARNMAQARATMASLVQSEAFHDMVVNGIAPDGSIEWPAAGIVTVLRQAASELSEGGWASLDRARRWIEANHPEQTPAKYGCRTWPQVLAESRLFDLEYRPGEKGRKVARYRVRSAT